MARSAHHEAVRYFEQALRALPHLPEMRETREQAIDLRLALRSALHPCGDLRRAMAYLREAETLAVALDDTRRLGQVSVYLSLHFYLMGAYDQAIAAAQRALALATAGGEVVLHLLANLHLGIAYQTQGDYRRAIDCLWQTMTSLDSVQRHKRFGEFILAVFIPAYLAACHAELGTFAEGSSVGDEGLQMAEAVDHPMSLMFASWGIGLLALRQGDLSRAVPLLERAVRSCQDADRPACFPLMAAALGATYTLARRTADAMLLLTQALEHAIATEVVVTRRSVVSPWGKRSCWRAAWRKRTPVPRVRCRSPVRIRNWAMRRMPCTFSVRSRRGASLRSACWPQHTTSRPCALAEELGMRPLKAHCHRGLGTLDARRAAGADSCRINTAIKLYRAMDMTFWLP